MRIKLFLFLLLIFVVSCAESNQDYTNTYEDFFDETYMRLNYKDNLRDMIGLCQNFSKKNREKDYQGECYNILGLVLGDKYDNMSLALEQCSDIQDVITEHKAMCFIGVGRKIGERHNLTESIRICSNTPEVFLQDCYIPTITQKSLYYNYTYLDLYGANELCDLPKKYEIPCYISLAHFVGVEFEDLNHALEVCMKFPDVYSGFCFDSLGHSYGDGGELEELFPLPKEFTSMNISSLNTHYFIVGVCSHFGPKFYKGNLKYETFTSYVPLEFQGYCMEGIGLSMGLNFNSNIYEARDRCLDLPDEAEEDCVAGLSQSLFRFFDGNMNKVEKWCESAENYTRMCYKMVNYSRYW